MREFAEALFELRQSIDHEYEEWQKERKSLMEQIARLKEQLRERCIPDPRHPYQGDDKRIFKDVRGLLIEMECDERGREFGADCVRGRLTIRGSEFIGLSGEELAIRMHEHLNWLATQVGGVPREWSYENMHKRRRMQLEELRLATRAEVREADKRFWYSEQP